MKKMSRAIKLLSQITVCYILATIIVFLVSDRSIFVPPSPSYKDSDQIIKLTTANGKKISAEFFPNPYAKYVVLYSHGNSVDIQMITPFLRQLHTWGFAAISYDYEGYGTSEGHSSEQATYRDINAVYDYLIKIHKYKPEHIILYGRSLGSGPTIELATHKQVAGVILEGAFVSAYRVVTYLPIFAFDKFNNIAKINQIHAPLMLIHGTADEVVPFWHAQALYATYNGTKHHLWLKNGLHNDTTYRKNEYREAFLGFTQSLQK